MADLLVEFDALASNVDGTNPGTAFALTRAAGWSTTGFQAPAAEPKLNWSGSVDSDGDVRADANAYGNRVVTLELLQQSTSAALLQAAVDQLRLKLAKVDREGGTLKITYASGDVRIYDLQATGHTVNYEPIYGVRNYIRVTVTLTAAPFSRGPEVDLGDNVETTAPALIFTDTGVAGDVAALGRLVIDNDSTSDQFWATWGIESDRWYTHTTSSGAGSLFYEAETRTPMGGATSGGGVVSTSTLPTTWTAFLSTQASGGGAHLNHVGTFRVYARTLPTNNGGTVSVALEWAVGDFRRFTRNPVVTLDASRSSTAVVCDLGVVTLPKIQRGTQQWEGRLVATNTVNGGSVAFDWLMLVPVNYGSGVAEGMFRYFIPTSFLARDEFDQTAGALTGKTMAVGGTWGGSGDTDDFQVSGAGLLTRATTLDTAPRYATVTGSQTSVIVQVDAAFSALPATSTVQFGPVARWSATTSIIASVAVTNASVVASLVGTSFLSVLQVNITNWFKPGTFATIRLQVDAGGRAAMWAFPVGTVPRIPLLEFFDPSLATGGAVATGQVGIWDYNAGTSGITRTFDNFWAASLPADAAVFANQSLEVRHNGISREDSAGTFQAPVSRYVGDLLQVPAAGAESRQVRTIVKLSRNHLATQADVAADDVSARLYATPRYLT